MHNIYHKHSLKWHYGTVFRFDRISWWKRIRFIILYFTNTWDRAHLVVVSKATKSLQETSEGVHSKLCPPGMLCTPCLTAGSCHPLVIPRTDAPALCPCQCPCLVCPPCPVSILPLCPEEPRHSVNSSNLCLTSTTRQRNRQYDARDSPLSITNNYKIKVPHTGDTDTLNMCE